jgi:hypothetical protein
MGSEIARFTLADKVGYEVEAIKPDPNGHLCLYSDHLTLLAQARAQEREACAKVAEEPITNPRIDVGTGIVSVCKAISSAIRQREGG